MINQQFDMFLFAPAKPIPFAEFKVEFLGLYRVETSSPATLAKLEQVCRLLEDLGVETTDQLDVSLVGRFIASRPPGQSPHTLRGLLMQLRVVCYYAEGRRSWPAPPSGCGSSANGSGSAARPGCGIRPAASSPAARRTQGEHRGPPGRLAALAGQAYLRAGRDRDFHGTRAKEARRLGPGPGPAQWRHPSRAAHGVGRLKTDGSASRSSSRGHWYQSWKIGSATAWTPRIASACRRPRRSPGCSRADGRPVGSAAAWGHADRSPPGDRRRGRAPGREFPVVAPVLGDRRRGRGDSRR